MSKKPSKLDEKRSGPYRVDMTTVNPHTGTYTQHAAYVDQAESPRDAFKKAEGSLSGGAQLVAFTVVFLGLASTGVPLPLLGGLTFIWGLYRILRWIVS